MRLLALILALTCFCGCILPPQLNGPTPYGADADILKTTTTTTQPTPTTHQPPVIKDPTKLFTTSTSTTSTSTTSTTTSTTSTTLSLTLKLREYAFAGDNSFYLKEIKTLEGVNYHTIKYKTSDGQWDTETFTDKLYVDDKILQIKPKQTTTTSAQYIPNEDALSKTPDFGTVLLLGGSLGERRFGDHTISLEAPLGDRYRLRINYANQTNYADIPAGGIAYYHGLELGVLQTPTNKGYVLVYAVNDSGAYKKNQGQRYCQNTLKQYYNAQSTILSHNPAVVGGLNLSLEYIDYALVGVNIHTPGQNQTLPISCGSQITTPEKQINLVWVGSTRLGTAKIVVSEKHN